MRELPDADLRQVDPRGQCGLLGRGVIELILPSFQRGLGGFRCRLEWNRVDLEEHIALLDRPVRLDRHLGHLPSHPRHNRDDVILRPHFARRRRDDVHEQDDDRQCDDRNGDDDDLAGDVPREPLLLEEDEPDDDRVDDEEDDFHYA